MFLGTFQHTLDPKGRVILPAIFRDELGEGLVMTVGMDNCVTLHPMLDWQRVIERLSTLRSADASERSRARMVTADAHPETLDKQGRITIPARLREYASLGRDVTVVGNNAHIELWDTTTWAAYRAGALAAYAATDQANDPGT